MKTDGPIVLFDGVCNLCNGSVNFLIDRDPKKIFKLASLQSDFGAELLTHADPPIKDLSTIVLYENGRFYRKSTAVLKIASRLAFPYKLLSVFLIVPAFLRNLGYDFVARNRYKWFGELDQCRIPEPGIKDRFVG